MRKRLVKLSSYIFLALFTILVLEIISFMGLVANNYILNEKTLKISIADSFQEIKNVYKEKTSYGSFDPITSVRLLPGGKYGVLPVGEYGFIENGNNDKSLDFSFNKSEEIIRIILLGGSSTAGSGSENISQTISAQLEKMLNTNGSEDGSAKYQVLNFGAGGGYSGAEYIKFIQYLIYYEPDIVISLDGFNDAWNAIFEKERVGIKNPIVNWSDYSYKYFESLNGLSTSRLNENNALPFIPSTSIVFNKIYKKIILDKSQKEKFYLDYPNYRLSKKIYQSDPYFKEVLRTNLESFASYTCRNDLIYIGLLQPQAYSKYENLTENEEYMLSIFENRYKSAIKDRENYSRLINDAFNSYSNIYEELDIKYSDCENVQFMDLMNIFEVKENDTYVDNIHYTPYGNLLLAKKYLEIIKQYQ